MRKRLALGLLAAVAASGCSGATATTNPPSPSDNPLADCARSITPWLQDYLDGKPDLGDYQEMGLSSAEGGALRDLQRQAAALKAQGPLPSGWAVTAVQKACTSIVASEATITSRPPGWP